MTQELKKILYAEDDPDIQEVTVLALETFGGYLVETCNSGAAVVSASQRFEPDLILLDVMMPDVDGPTALEALQCRAELKIIPVIFITAKVLNAEIERFKKLGALDVITKPYNPVTLCDQIVKIWNRRNEQRVSAV
jgi:two-component system, OmpR family, response regulator